jgi:hypothetical protein
MIQTFKRRNDHAIDRIEWDSAREIATYFYLNGSLPAESFLRVEQVRNLVNSGVWISVAPKSYEQIRMEKAIKSSQARMKTDDLWHNGFHPISPLQIIDSIETAKEEIDFSNYDCENLNRAREILLRYCEEHGIKVN